MENCSRASLLEGPAASGSVDIVVHVLSCLQGMDCNACENIREVGVGGNVGGCNHKPFASDQQDIASKQIITPAYASRKWA